MWTLLAIWSLMVSEPDLAVTANRVWAGEQWIEDGVVLVREGVIVGVGSRLPIPEGVERLEVLGGSIVPGGLLFASRLGIEGRGHKDPDPAVLRRAEEWLRLDRAIVLAARSRGWTAAHVLPPAPKRLSIGEAVIVGLRAEAQVDECRIVAPSSIVIELGELELADELDVLAALRRALMAPGHHTWMEAVRAGEATLGIVAPRRTTLDRVVAVCEGSGLMVTWVAGRGAVGLSSRGLSVRIGSTLAIRRLPRGVPSMPTCWQEPASLRDLRWEGLRSSSVPESLWSSFSSAPAGLLGLGDRVGQIALGMRADLVVYDGPLDAARTAVAATVVDGRVLPSAAADEKR
ncbi:MAG: amidohydrolase family protein [Planctomycetota bacterium]